MTYRIVQEGSPDNYRYWVEERSWPTWWLFWAPIWVFSSFEDALKFCKEQQSKSRVVLCHITK